MSFTVTGKFPNELIAHDVEQIIAKLFTDIVKFHAENEYTGYSKNPYSQKDAPTPAEFEISAKYNIEWDETLDWLHCPIDRHVIQFENFVFVTTQVYKGRKTPDRIEQLLKHFADHVYVGKDNFPELIILTQIKCKAPNEQVAKEISSEINLYLINKDTEYLIPPFEVFHPFLELSALGLLYKPYDKSVPLVDIQYVVGVLYQYQKAKMLRQPLTEAQSNALSALEALRTQGYAFPRGINTEFLPDLIHEIGGTTGTSSRGKKVEATGHVIYIPELWFIYPELGIPAIHAYLTAKGCTDIEIALTSVPYASKPEYI